MNRDVCEHFNPVDLPCDKCKSANVQKSTLREAAEMALKALIEYEEHEEQEYGFHRKMAEIDALGGTPPAIVALRAALVEPVQEPYAWMAVGGTIWRHKTSEDDVPLYTAPRVPLAEWQINDLMADIDPEDRDSWSFRQGVYAAEKYHGVRK